MLRKRHRLDPHERAPYHTNIASGKTELNRKDDHRSKFPNDSVYTYIRVAAILIFSSIAYRWWRWPMSSFSNHERISSKAARDDCGCYLHDGTGARIAYLITLHNERTLNDSLDLVKSIAAPRNIILIHVDRKLSMQDYEGSELNEFSEGRCQACGAKVLVESKFDLDWGQWNMNLPTHWSMSELTSNPSFVDQWDVFINVSADTMPVYTPQVLSNYFDPIIDVHRVRGFLHNINFVTSSSCATGLVPTNVKTFPLAWHKRKHYESHGDFDITYISEGGLKKSETLEIHFGSQWMILTPDFVRYLASALRREDSLPSIFKNELIARERLMSDETFIPTILAHHTEFRETMPKLEKDGSLALGPMGLGMKIESIRYERMDENMPDAYGNVVHVQRYDVPKSSTANVPRKWGPYFLGIYDLGNIKKSGALFIRKVAKDVDPNIFNILPVSHSDEIPPIHWPREVKLSEKIDWEPILEYTKRMRTN